MTTVEDTGRLIIELERQSDGQRRRRENAAILLVEMGGYRRLRGNDGLAIGSLVGCCWQVYYFSPFFIATLRFHQWGTSIFFLFSLSINFTEPALDQGMSSFHPIQNVLDLADSKMIRLMATFLRKIFIPPKILKTCWIKKICFSFVLGKTNALRV